MRTSTSGRVDPRVLGALALLAPAALAAQQPAPRDTARADAAGRDTVPRPAVRRPIVRRPSVRRDTAPHALETVRVLGRIDDLIGTATSASEGRVGALDLRARPITREGELLETVPGLILTQHSGEGKANQYFVRGFNLDHGTDFQTRVDGVPVNAPTHAHGQGYTDLNFLIPELVDYLDYRLGVSHAAVGDFGSAGAAEFHLRRTLDRPFATVASGANGLARLAGGNATPLGPGTLLLGGEVKTYDGPWVRAERLRKLSGLARYSWAAGASQFSLTGMAYHNRWNSNDQVPERAVDDGLISPYGQIDSTDGGRTRRYSLSGEWRHAAGRSVQTVQLYGVRSALALFSDFTYFLDDPVDGDQFSQAERRTTAGANASDVTQGELWGVPQLLTVGVQARQDWIGGLGLYHTVAQRRVGTVREDRVRETGAGVYAEAQSRWTPWFRTVLGVREDAYAFGVRSDVVENSGARTAAIASPKASLIFTPSPAAELYLSGGFGFHSNDARGTVIRVDPSTRDTVPRVDPLVRSRGAEAGVRTTTLGGLRSTASVWALDLDGELLFTGDAGTTEPSSASRRVGVTFANFYRPAAGALAPLALDADVSFARARFHNADGTVTRIPGALEHVVAGGATWNAARAGLFGALRVRHFGSYALAEDDGVRARAATLLNADAGYQLPPGARMRGARLQLTVLNLAGARAADIQYYYASRLRGEAAGGVDDVHVHPVEPRQLRLSLGWGF